jgi:integrase/recombinase XerC
MSTITLLRPASHLHPVLRREPRAPMDAVIRHLHHLQLLGHAATTVYARKRALTRLAIALPVPLLDATAEHFAAWRETLRMSPDGIAHEVGHARQFYRWAAAEGLLAASPAEGLPVPKVGRRLPRPISEDDLIDVLQRAAPRVRPWLVLAGWAGFRACEIALLDRRNVLDTAAPPVFIVAGDATKGISERVVPISAFVLAELRAAGMPGSGYMFRRRDGRRGPNQPWLISQLSNNHLHDCGHAETLHQLRHRFLTMAYRVTRDLRLVQELAGHASPKTTAGYAAFDQADAAAAVEALPVPRRLRSVSPGPDHKTRKVQ